jgi:hypothetical protein
VKFEERLREMLNPTFDEYQEGFPENARNGFA